MIFKPGDVVFFKKAKKSAQARGNTECIFKGHGIGVFLGHLQPFAKEPPQSVLTTIMGSIGYVSFDDINELMGEKVLKEVMDKFMSKYHPGGEAQEGILSTNQKLEALANSGEGLKTLPSELPEPPHGI